MIKIKLEMNQLIAALILISLFFSCKKKQEDTPYNLLAGKVKQVTDDNNRRTIYTYDNKGRLLKFFQVNATGDTSYVVSHEYSGNSLTRTERYSTTDSRVYTYQLNEKGAAVSKTVASNPSVLYNFKYNSNGQLTEQKMTNGSNVETYTYFYSNSQCDSMRLERSWYTAGNYELTVYEYYTDETDNRNEHLIYFQQFLGKPANLKPLRSLKEGTHRDATGNSFYTPNSYTYEYDSNGKIMREIEYFRGSTNPRTKTYQYY
ncbi:MAG: hypothetical protein QM725_02125 [Lacibacter sp.]